MAKNTINVTVADNTEYNEYTAMLESKGFEQIGTRLFEDVQSYVRVTIEQNTTNEEKEQANMTYFEARETYAELFKKYPEVSGVFTDNEDEKRIMYRCENYEKHGSRWELVDITEERINYVFYYNVVDPRASRFMRNLGGYERTTVNYTKRGYIPTECVSISPDRTAKTVRRFEFI